MATNDNFSAATPQSPTHLPPRYEIRKLTPSHAQWASAIVMHSNLFHSTYFPLVHPEKPGQRFLKLLQNGSYIIDHQIASGHSHGIFDTEYIYKRPESARTSGHFYLDPTNDNPTGSELLEAMDFPLVSVAMAYDAINPFDYTRLAPIFEYLPTFPLIYHALNSQDKRDPKSWEATGPNQVLMRAATSTRHDYEGRGLMGALARFLMRQAASEGFRGINIESVSDGVKHVWLNPPSPFKGELVSTAGPDWETENEQGEIIRPHAASPQEMNKIYVHLK